MKAIEFQKTLLTLNLLKIGLRNQLLVENIPNIKRICKLYDIRLAETDRDEFLSLTLTKAIRWIELYEPERSALNSWVFGKISYLYCDFMKKKYRRSVEMIPFDEYLRDTLSEKNNREFVSDCLNVAYSIGEIEGDWLTYFAYSHGREETMSGMNLSKNRYVGLKNRVISELKKEFCNV